MTNPAAEESSNSEANSNKVEANGGTKARSETAYPFFGLTHGIATVEAVRRAGGKEASNADVMRELGIASSTNRAWAYGIPAAIQFNLIERIGRGDEGRIKITDLGMRVVFPGDPDEARAAKIEAFKKPELYQRLLEKFGGSMPPSKDGLKNILYRDFKIVESMAPNAAEAFLDSLKIADLIEPSGLICRADGAPRPEEKPVLPPVERSSKHNGSDSSTQTITVPADFIVYKCKIGKGRVIEIPLPPQFSKAEVGRLYAFLQTQVDDDDTEPQND